MASTLPASPLTDCCTTCITPVTVNVPGPEGPPAVPCTPCTDGMNAFATIVGGGVLVPAYGATATIELSSPPGSLWIGQGQTLYVQSFGYFRVDAIPDPTHVTLFNWGYAGNVNGNGILTFTAGERVQPGGLAGTTGSPSGADFAIANNLSEGVPATMRSNLGLGTIATAAAGDYFAVANNLSEGVAATKRTNLGLGTAAVKDSGVANLKLPPVDQVAGLTVGDAVFATASGVETKTAAAARTALGIVSNSGSYAILRFKVNSGTASGAFSNVGTVQVPLNNIYKDDDGIIIALAANRFSLNVGTYRIRAAIPGYLVDLFQSLLYDFSNTVALAYGTNGDATIDVTSPAYSQTGYSFLDWRWTVPASPTVYEIQAKCTTNNGTNGWGQTKSFGGAFDEVYINVEILKEA